MMHFSSFVQTIWSMCSGMQRFHGAWGHSWIICLLCTSLQVGPKRGKKRGTHQGDSSKWLVAGLAHCLPSTEGRGPSLEHGGGAKYAAQLVKWRWGGPTIELHRVAGGVATTPLSQGGRKAKMGRWQHPPPLRVARSSPAIYVWTAVGCSCSC